MFGICISACWFFFKGKDNTLNIISDEDLTLKNPTEIATAYKFQVLVDRMQVFVFFPMLQFLLIMFRKHRY